MDIVTIADTLLQLGILMALFLIIFFTWYSYPYQAPKVLKQSDWWWFIVPIGGFFLAAIGSYTYSLTLQVLGIAIVISWFLWVFRVFFISYVFLERYRVALSRKPGIYSDQMKKRFLQIFEKRYPSSFIRFKQRCGDIEYQVHREKRS